MHLVTDHTAWDREKEITQHWSGIVFYPEKNATWQNAANDEARKRSLQNKIFAAIGISVGLALFIWAAAQGTGMAAIAFGLLSLFGLVIAFFILAAELGYQNKVVKQVCGAVSAGGCEKVLQSKQAKSFFGFTPADLGLIYFLTQFFAFVAAAYMPALHSVSYFIALSGIAVAGWSIYTQAIILKKYCALCLALVCVLLLQFCIAIFVTNLSLIQLTPIIFYAITFLAFALALFPVKYLLKTTTAQKQKLAELRKWKTDAAIFHALTANEPLVNTDIWENDLLLGDPQAPVRITVACNPYCGPCAKAHEELDKILEANPNEVAVQVRLLCNPDNTEDLRTIATTAILRQANIQFENKEIKSLLSDWFHDMNLEKWQQKWLNETDQDVYQQLMLHKNWSTDVGIAHTPTFFINGKKMPGQYSLADIKKLIPELAMAGKENILQ